MPVSSAHCQPWRAPARAFSGRAEPRGGFASLSSLSRCPWLTGPRLGRPRTRALATSPPSAMAVAASKSCSGRRPPSHFPQIKSRSSILNQMAENGPNPFAANLVKELLPFFQIAPQSLARNQNPDLVLFNSKLCSNYLQNCHCKVLLIKLSF